MPPFGGALGNLASQPGSEAGTVQIRAQRTQVLSSERRGAHSSSTRRRRRRHRTSAAAGWSQLLRAAQWRLTPPCLLRRLLEMRVLLSGAVRPINQGMLPLKRWLQFPRAGAAPHSAGRGHTGEPWGLLESGGGESEQEPLLGFLWEETVKAG